MEQEESKYYTPDISDIRFGYEYEQLMGSPFEDNSNWAKCTFPKDPFIGDRLIAFSKVIETGIIRTPYLTNKQIQVEGWEIEGIYPGDKVLFIKYGHESKKWGYELIYNNTALKITKFWTIWPEEKMLRETVFRGICKSINELRVITKQVLE